MKKISLETAHAFLDNAVLSHFEKRNHSIISPLVRMVQVRILGKTQDQGNVYMPATKGLKSVMLSFPIPIHKGNCIAETFIRTSTCQSIILFGTEGEGRMMDCCDAALRKQIACLNVWKLLCY